MAEKFFPEPQWGDAAGRRALGMEPKDPNASCGPAQASLRNLGQLLNSLELSFHFLTCRMVNDACLER